MSHPRQTLYSIGKINKGSREYKTPTPVKLYIQLGRSTKVVVGNVKVPPAFNLYIQLGRSTTAFGTIKVPPPLNFTFSWEDQQRYLDVFGMMMMMMIWNEPAQVPMLRVLI